MCGMPVFERKGAYLENLPVLYCHIKFLTVYVFGSCFRVLAAVLVSDYFSGYKCNILFF